MENNDHFFVIRFKLQKSSTMAEQKFKEYPQLRDMKIERYYVSYEIAVKKMLEQRFILKGT